MRDGGEVVHEMVNMGGWISLLELLAVIASGVSGHLFDFA